MARPLARPAVARRASNDARDAARAAMDVAGQLDPVVDALVEAVHDGVLETARGLPRDRALAHAPAERGHDLGHREIRHQEVAPALDAHVELLATGFGQIQLQEGAGVAVEGPRQP